MNTRPALAIVLAAAAVTLAACSSAPKSDAAAAPSHPAWPRVNCASKAPTSMVGGTLGMQLSDPQEVHQDPVTVCTYLLKSKTNAVVLRFQTGADQTIFASGRTGYASGTTDIPGFQDAAYSNVATAGTVTTNTLAAIKGTVEVVVTSTASVDQEKTLEQQLFAALP
jgi:hypothetical protein